MWNPSRLWRRKETLDRGNLISFLFFFFFLFFFLGVYVSRLGPGERLTEVSGITSCIYNTTRVDPSRWCSVITPNKHTTTSPPYISLSLSYPSVAKKQGQETSIDLLHHPADRDGVDSILQLPLLLRVWIGANNNNNGCIGQQPVYIYIRPLIQSSPSLSIGGWLDAVECWTADDRVGDIHKWLASLVHNDSARPARGNSSLTAPSTGTTTTTRAGNVFLK